MGIGSTYRGDALRLALDRRHILAGLAGALTLTAIGRCDGVSAAGIDDYVDRWVLPELRPMAHAIMTQAAGEPPLSMQTLAARRAVLAGPSVLPAASVPVEVRRIPVPGNAPPVEIVVINARPGTSRPGLLHMHGGGFIAGSAKASVDGLVSLCKELDCCAVSVNYRLAPETDWRGSIEDNHAGLKWLHAHAAPLGVDPARIAVMGESAGGGHAALLAITARDRGEVPVAFQCLVYPMLDDRTGSSRPVADHVGRIIWSAADNRFGWNSFLGQAPGTDDVPAKAVPARLDDLTGLPPAFIGVGAIDLFHDEDAAYAGRLNQAGVPTELIVVPGAFHVFDLMPTSISGWFNQAKRDALRRALHIPLAPAAG